jgi:hypothetical protein
MYDIFYIGPEDTEWKKIKTKFPLSKRADDFQTAQQKSFTIYFWIVWNDLHEADDFNFDYKVSKWDAEYIHVFRNVDLYDGVCLFPKKISISNRELDYRWFAHKKEVDIVASRPKAQAFDVVFISYHEPNADMHYAMLTQKLSRHVFRVDGIKGIHNAHKKAASLVSTDMFWVVDADAVIVDDFNFDYQVTRHNYNTVYVWRSSNPINNLEYGYGGVKLLPTRETLDMDMNSADMTTSISPKFQAVPSLSNITAFNTTPFNTWRSAFRECCKLASKSIDRQDNIETIERLEAWCQLNDTVSYGYYGYSGALAGRLYGQENAGNLPALSKINDFDWLKEKFEQSRSLMETHLQ